MRLIVDDLPMLASADGIIRAPLYLEELVAECVRAVRTLAAARAVTVELPEEAPFVGDEALLHRPLRPQSP